MTTTTRELTEQVRLANGQVLKALVSSGIRTIVLTMDELDRLKAYVIKERLDWPFVFSCNRLKHKWAFVTRGWTDFEDRVEVDHYLLEEIVKLCLRRRPSGGRIFVNDNGAYWRGTGRRDLLYKIVEFDVV